MMVSDSFVNAVRCSPLRNYRLARLAGVTPQILSKWINRACDPKPNDPRVFAIADIVGVVRERVFQADNDDVIGQRPGGES